MGELARGTREFAACSPRISYGIVFGKADLPLVQRTKGGTVAAATPQRVGKAATVL
jgi:hypothetical protein